jgi:hypothetical protein
MKRMDWMRFVDGLIVICSFIEIPVIPLRVFSCFCVSCDFQLVKLIPPRNGPYPMQHVGKAECCPRLSLSKYG